MSETRERPVTRLRRADLPGALMPAAMLLALLAVPAVGVVDHRWGALPPAGPAADPLAVASATYGRECVEPADAGLEHLDALVVADTDTLDHVRLVPFDQGWAAAERGEVETLLACTPEETP
jgi:hypothetical protein